MEKLSLSSPNNIYRNRPKILETLTACAKKLMAKSQEVRKIILFGSLARGDYGLYSDADILIILTKSNYDRYFDRIPELSDSFYESEIPVEIFPYTLEEIENMKNAGNSFIITALSEGIELQ